MASKANFFSGFSFFKRKNPSSEAKRALLVVGLGNPGPRYANTRHNVGFMAVDFLAGVDAAWKKEKSYLIAKTEAAIFIKPETFMNLSGTAVQVAMTKHKIPLSNVTVIHDDIDLKLGDTRTKTGGGHAGHNGLKSIDAAIGRDYKRIRIGIGRPEILEQDVSSWVLGRWTKTELDAIQKSIANISIE